ncbi:MAG: hypothetical protein Ta2A_14350 [Treponemataceae bacterium]|nr:MAG: hypothetical protein Ta2A_14350 [Treponemataceae bacterium]
MKTKRTGKALAPISNGMIFKVGALIAAAFVFFSCDSLVSVVPRKMVRDSGASGNKFADLKLTDLRYSVNTNYEAGSSSFDKAPQDLYYTLNIESDALTVWINPVLNMQSASVTYQTVDKGTLETSEAIETTGLIKLNVSVIPDLSLYLTVNSTVYTIRITKNTPENVVFVSPSGDGSGTDYDNGQRGLTPDTAFYSLYAAAEKALGLADYRHVMVLGELKQDVYLNERSNGDGSVFRITSTDGKRLVISGGKYGQYTAVEPVLSAEGAWDAAKGKAKRVLSVSGSSQVELRGLTITGSGKRNGTESYNDDSLVDKGGGILVTGSAASVTLRAVTVTGNAAQDSGGGIYIGGAAVELGESTRIYENRVASDFNLGSSVYYNSGTLTFSGDGAALKVDTSTSAINDAVLGAVPDTVYVAGDNVITVDATAVPLIDAVSSTYHGLAAYVVLPPDNYLDGWRILQGAGIAGDISDNRFMRFRSYGGTKLWAINEFGNIASSASYYVGVADGNDYYDGLSPATAFNSLECALAYANAAKNQNSFINRKLTILSELTEDNHTDLRYPGVLSGEVVSGTPAVFDITFDGEFLSDSSGVFEYDEKLLCTTDIVITSLDNTLKFACNFTGASLIFEEITLYNSVYKDSLVYGEGFNVFAEDLVFSDNLEVGGSFDGKVTVDTLPDNPVVFKRPMENSTLPTKFFDGDMCEVTVKAGQLNFMGSAKLLTIDGGIVTDEYNTNTDSEAKSVQLKGGRLVVAKPFIALVNKYPAGALSFEGGHIPVSTGYGIVLRDDAGAAALNAIETHAPLTYFDESAFLQNYIARIYLDDEQSASQLRGYKVFAFDNFLSGQDASDLAAMGETLDGVVAKYDLRTANDHYGWQIGTDTVNTKTLGLLGRRFVVGDIINHEKTFFKTSSFDKDWTPLPSELVERQSVVYKIDGNGTVWKAMYWGLLTDDHNPTNHDAMEEDTESKRWYYRTGDAVRTDVMDGSTIPGGRNFKDGNWVIPRETDGGGARAAGATNGTNNIGKPEWVVIVESLNIPASSYKIGENEAFWTEASMGPLVGFFGVGGGSAAIIIALSLILVSYGMGMGMGLGVIAVACIYGLMTTLGLTLGAVIGMAAAGNSIFEMLYKPAEDDYEMSDEDDDWHVTIVIQSFDNYVCYDPDPAHAL